MRTLFAAGLALAVLAAAGSASAHVVEVTTSVPVEDVADPADLRDKLRTVVDDTLSGAISFQPTLIALTEARVLGERLYVKLLFADADGERTLDELSAARAREPRSEPSRIGPADAPVASEPI